MYLGNNTVLIYDPDFGRVVIDPVRELSRRPAETSVFWFLKSLGRVLYYPPADSKQAGTHLVRGHKYEQG